MSGVRMRARADLRSRLASVVILTIATGTVGAVAITAFTSARRSDTAYARFREATQEPEVVVAGCHDGVFPPLDIDRVANLQMVASADRFLLVNPVGSFLADGKTSLFGRDPFDGGLLAPKSATGQPALKVMEGRLPETIDEAAVAWGPGNEHAQVGDTIVVRMFSDKVSPQDIFSGQKPTAQDFEPDIKLTVTGIVLTPNDLNGSDSTVLTTQAFYEAHKDAALGCQAAALHLRDGLAGIPAVGEALSQIKSNAFFFDMTSEAVIASRSTHLRSIVTRLFGWLVVIAGLLVVGQALVRRTVLASTDDPILRALGMSRWQITRVALATGMIVGLGGALMAIVVSLAASPFTLFGAAKLLDPVTGIYVDRFVTIGGAMAIVVVSLLLVGVPAWRLAAARGGVAGAVELSGSGRPSRLASMLAATGVPVTAVAGARLALEPGHGRTATPVRSAVAGLALTVAAMIAAVGFAASMQHFVSTPELWGITGDFGTGNPYAGDLFATKALPLIEKSSGFSDMTVGNFQNAVYLGTPDGEKIAVNAWGLTPVKGEPVVPTMLAGRWPERDDEIALGEVTLRQIDAHIGDVVHVSAGTHAKDLTIVGEPVFPDLGFGPGFGQGAGMTFEGLTQFYPDAQIALAIGRFAPGVDQQAVLKPIEPTLRQMGAGFQPGDLAQLGDSTKEAQRSQNVPLVLASLFTLTALATLVHVLITSVRRRRKDLAILRTLGFTRRQVATTVAWQSVVLAVLALLIGVPAGVLIGRLGWSLFATGIGVVSVPVIAWVPVIAAIPATIVAAVLISIGPALAARRTMPAMVLRAE
ncbi:MAG TPA: FtsX-like permease family protein [Actinomycetota bacterium]|nr:FtsX-like permease family protein [Actinomycetota bacterium]